MSANIENFDLNIPNLVECNHKFTLHFYELSENNGNDEPRVKRRRPNAGIDDQISRIFQSQPVPQTNQDDCDGNGNESNIEMRSDFCFSQPTLMDDLLLCTQLNTTQGQTQNVFHRLVKRMTRFYVTTKCDETVKRLIAAIVELNYVYKSADASIVSVADGVAFHFDVDLNSYRFHSFISQITVSTIDRRKLQLVFKINVIEMDNNIMVDFRLSKGDGIEFKKSFVKVKKSLSDIIGKELTSW